MRTAVAPPRGKLFQEELRRYPFWMLVACVLVNKTTWEQAEPAFLEMRERWPEPAILARANLNSLYAVMRPLGLWRNRSKGLKRLAERWLSDPPADAAGVAGLPMCGRYAADSWAIFIERRRDVEPNDGKLNWYLMQSEQRRLEMTKAVKKTTKEQAKKISKELTLRPRAEVVQMREPPERPLMSIRTQEEIDFEVSRMPEVQFPGCIKDVACQLLTAVRCDDPEDARHVGFSYAAILHKIALMFPGSQTSNACLRWYLVRIRQEWDGFNRFPMPIKFKRPKTIL